MSSHTLEMKFEIWNDDHGARVEIGEDRDGLGMMEIRQIESDGKTYGRITFDEKAIPLAIEAMQKFHAFLQGREHKGAKVPGNRSLGLEYEEEVRKMRREDIQTTIREKELASLKQMPLNELRTTAVSFSDYPEMRTGGPKCTTCSRP